MPKSKIPASPVSATSEVKKARLPKMAVAKRVLKVPRHQSSESHKNGSAMETAVRTQVVNDLKSCVSAKAGQLVLQVDEHFEQKQKKGASALARWSEEQQQVLEQRIDVFLEALALSEPMLQGAKEFGGVVLICAPIDTDAIEADVRDIILWVTPNAVRSKTGQRIDNIHRHQVDIGISIKKDSWELRSCRSRQAQGDEKNAVCVNVGNIVGQSENSPHVKVRQMSKLGTDIQVVQGKKAKKTANSVKRSIVTKATHQMHAIVRRIQKKGNEQQVQALENQLFGSVDYHLMHFKMNQSTVDKTQLEWIKLNRFGRMGATLNAQGGLEYEKAKYPRAKKIVSVSKVRQLVVKESESEDQAHKKLEQQRTDAEHKICKSVKVFKNKFDIVFDNRFSGGLRGHNGSSTLGVSMIKGSSMLKNLHDLFEVVVFAGTKKESV